MLTFDFYGVSDGKDQELYTTAVFTYFYTLFLFCFHTSVPAWLFDFT